MFATLGQRLHQTFKTLTGRGSLTEDNIKEALQQVREALLDADVALPVVTQFIEDIRHKALGEKVIASITPGQALIKIVNDELTATLGNATAEINLRTTPPAVILMAGLQGSGKTTSSVKLANLLHNKLKKKVLLVSTDVYRPAAIEQLHSLANSINLECYPSSVGQDPVAIANQALAYAKQHFFDVLIIDTAGRLHVDNDMMAEVKSLHAKVKPIETLFVVDSMTGQDAANTAKVFNETLPLTGIILTKVDGDARGGAALSIWYTIHKPIKFIGVSEKIDGLEVFHPDRVASRILGMGDIVSLVEDVQQKLDEEKAQKMARKLKKGGKFDFDDMLEQLQQMNKLGDISSIMAKIPGMSNVPAALKNKVNDKMFVKMRAIIQSMTYQERHFPALIKGSRKVRIAKGSGTEVQDINQLIKQFEQMQKMMKKFSNLGAMQKMAARLMPGNRGGFPF